MSALDPQALRAVADRVEAMLPPPRIRLSQMLIPVSAAHADGYAEGHDDALKRVVFLLRKIASQQHTPTETADLVATLKEEIR